MEYNTERSRLTVPEYGRNIQNMAEFLLTVEDREKRSRMAKTLVNIMTHLHPEVKDTPDARQKLWDHLHIICGFKLDVDSPFPPPQPELLEKKPQPIPYAQGKIPLRHYGKNIIRLIEEVSTREDGPEKEAMVKAIANHMKKSYLNWNRDSVTDEVIAEDLQKLSSGKLKLSDSTRLHETSEILLQQQLQRRKKYVGRPQNKPGKGRKSRP
ncbi:MAG: DUF4290 domain-containing protein [Bacteroidales bacterium]|nr:DUF4290 domain-containing protein [Bacteroidales bacterium]MDZ4205286.1 DUF4290 domain-containing protein [Bacteroidales bacterium]